MFDRSTSNYLKDHHSQIMVIIFDRIFLSNKWRTGLIHDLLGCIGLPLKLISCSSRLAPGDISGRCLHGSNAGLDKHCNPFPGVASPAPSSRCRSTANWRSSIILDTCFQSPVSYTAHPHRSAQYAWSLLLQDAWNTAWFIEIEFSPVQSLGRHNDPRTAVDAAARSWCQENWWAQSAPIPSAWSSWTMSFRSQ